MRVRLIPGQRDENLIALVRKTVEKCQHEEGNAVYYDAHQGKWSTYPHELGTCHGCAHPVDCTLMNLCHEYRQCGIIQIPAGKEKPCPDPKAGKTMQ